jgi:N-acetylmuramoyl-L-alanine amidase
MRSFGSAEVRVCWSDWRRAGLYGPPWRGMKPRPTYTVGSVALIATMAFAISLISIASAQDAETAYNEMLTRERVLRRELDLGPQRHALASGDATSILLDRIRGTVDGYEALVRQFPRSGYSDNALWQGAVLAADAFWQFGEARDRSTALRLFALIKSQYPTSSLVVQINGHVTRLSAADGSAPATLRSIRRDVLPDALRITLEFEREAIFQDERLDGPPRLFIDLRNTQTVEALKDATIAFPDDVVRQARIGRQPDRKTRVVFDLQSAGRHSVYSLYNPYRIIIDFERPGGAPAVSAPVAKDIQATKPAEQPAAGTSPASPSANSRGGFSLSRQLGLGISRIVIDPGHGGHDPGAQVRGLNEAELVLDIALRLEQLLSREPGVAVVLTRRANTYVALEQRTGIANRSAADLFLSIHANASENASARGFETYVLNFAPNPEAEAIAARENSGSAKTMGSLPDLIKAITLNNKIDESRDFASMLQQSMHTQLRRIDRTARNLGVKQAPFMVLVGATMPSALVEVSFLTHRQEATLLRTTTYRQQLAEALVAGIVKYQQSLKAASKVAAQ